jgi:phosphoribosyl-ATP pyrophosphohydrolase/phosphoribosyl-AMP cyclohydrolase
MLGYMNRPALNLTLESGKVTFYSRSKHRLWTKGEESGNYLELVELKTDCDQDTLLILAKPSGPVCHTGSDTCWQETNKAHYGFLTTLESVIRERKEDIDNRNSYVASLFRKGINSIAQKVGEEAIETVIEAKDNNDELFMNECADLLFHFLILLNVKGYSLDDVIRILEDRHNTG